MIVSWYGPYRSIVGWIAIPLIYKHEKDRSDIEVAFIGGHIICPPGWSAKIPLWLDQSRSWWVLLATDLPTSCSSDACRKGRSACSCLGNERRVAHYFALDVLE